MKQTLTNELYDTRLYATDWRYSSTILGLLEYFDYLEYIGLDIDYNIGDRYIEYNQKDINKKHYIEFAMYKLFDYIKYKKIETIDIEIFKQKDIDLKSKSIKKQVSIITNCLETIYLVKELISKEKAKEIVKKIYPSLYKENKDLNEIIQGYEYSIDFFNSLENQIAIFKYEFYEHIYSKFMEHSPQTKITKKINYEYVSNTRNKTCRLLGYRVDWGRKAKAMSYNYQTNTLSCEDILEFDFIPFGFNNLTSSFFSYENMFFFVNSNISINSLKECNKFKYNNELSKTRNNLIEILQEINTFNYFNIEIISKDIEKDYFESSIISKEITNVFENTNKIKLLTSCKDFNEILKDILDRKKLDKYILIKLKEYLSENEISKLNIISMHLNGLIDANYYIYNLYRKDENMNIKQKSAYKSGQLVYGYLIKSNPNKIKAYKHRLISALSINNKEKVLEILTYIHNYTNIKINFIYDLIEDFDANKNLIYTFIMAMNEVEKKENTENKGENTNE